MLECLALPENYHTFANHLKTAAMLTYNVIREVDKMELIANVEHLQDAVNIALTAWMNTDCHYIVISIQRFGILLIGHEVYATKSLEKLINPLLDGYGSLLDYSRQSN